MPVVGSDVAAHRIVLDESSLDLRAVPREQVAGVLDALADTLEELVGRPGGILTSSFLYGSPCLADADISDILFGPYDGLRDVIDRDARTRLMRLLDRCRFWDDYWSDLDIGTDITVAGRPVDLGFSVGFAAIRAQERQHVACLVAVTAPDRGFVEVSYGGTAAEVFFFADAAELSGFWRELFRREDVDEANFFAVAEMAFDRLVFASGLAFRHFDGSYRDVRDRVITVLSGVNDYFSTAHAEGAGVAHEVQARLGQFGLDVSPESSKTRGSSALMSARSVFVDGQEYVCDWHAKLERHRNRVHFALPDRRIEGRIVIGIFAAHLPT